ncbi:MAG: hypothetical protein NHG14_00020 [Candidatus Shikimatogenerans bostrichidophilus]|nr:MAG: hypothetical protein NHG14_00020 [Candidatus Shikimatogenerans bostrichidophilus]
MITKNLKKILPYYKQKKKYKIKEALKILKKYNFVKFNSTINLYININKSKNNILTYKNILELPYSNGKRYKLLVLIEKKYREDVKKLGINLVGGKDIIENINNEKDINFNVLISSKKYMKDILLRANILGKKNLIPNYETKTIINKNNYLNIITSYIKSKILLISLDKYGIFHLTIGKINYDNSKIITNIEYIIKKIKNISCNNKIIKIKNIYINTTMSPSLKLYNL